MPINQRNLETKLAAMRAKDLDAIVAEQVHIPFLSRPYTKTRLRNWLNKRITQLENVRDATDEQIAAVRDRVYGEMSAECKQVADKIIAREHFDIPQGISDANYDRLVAMQLIAFVTE